MVLGILAILATAAVLVINPTDMLARTRDSRRLTEVRELNKAVQIADTGGLSLGTAKNIYISIPDTSPVCANLGLPALPSGWSYVCSNTNNYRKVDGTGWMPINFSALSIGSPLSVLPVDPINSTSSLYYSYVVGGSWELTAWLESARYLIQGIKDGGDSLAYELGSDLLLTPTRKTSFSFGDFPVVTTRAGQAGWFKQTGAGTVSLAVDSESNYLNANSYAWYEWQENIPFNPNALYKISCRVRQTQDPTSGGKSIYCGVDGVAADKNTYINMVGANSFSGQHYFAVSNSSLTVGAGYYTFTGYFKGHGIPAGGPHQNPNNPGKMYPGVAYIRPLFILNYINGNGIADIDFEILEINN